MKFIKSIFTSSVFWVFFVMPVGSIALIITLHDTPHKYVGKVINVSSWNGNATLKTKTEAGKDTILTVVPNRYERFENDQIITVWTGGDLFDGIASTKPQH